jgi:hypothetical protein
VSQAMKLIVDGYLSLKDRSAISAIEDLRAHRQRLRKQLQDNPNIGQLAVLGRSIEEFDEELRVIEAALASF